MRSLAALGALAVLVLGSAPNALSIDRKPTRGHGTGRITILPASKQRLAARFAERRAAGIGPASRRGAARELSSLELDIVGRINVQRAARGLRRLRVVRGLVAAARYHSRQMGQLGFFEHESQNGAPFWRRIARFYPAGRGYWSVGENIFWESPETTPLSVVHEWMASPPHRQNILAREWRDIGVAAVHFDSAPGAFGGRPVTIVTADFGVRR
jgi:uncharacterized protein YkwD